MNYLQLMNKHGVSHADMQDKINNYCHDFKRRLSRMDSNNHVLDLGNKVELHIHVKEKLLNKKSKNFLLREDSNIEDLFEVSFYQNKSQLVVNPSEFFTDFNFFLRSLATVYIVGDPEAFAFTAIDEKVKALISSDFLESKLVGTEGTALTTDNIGDSNIPLQSIADAFAVIHKHLTDQAARTGTAEQLQAIPHPDVNNTSQNATYHALSGTTGKPTGEENTDGVLQTYKLTTGNFFQLFLPIRSSATSTNPLLYIRTSSNTSVSAWRPLITKEEVLNMVSTNTALLGSKINKLTTSTKPALSVFLSENTTNGTPINSVESSFPCYVGDGRIVYTNGSEGGELYIKSINDTSNGMPINSVGSASPCYVGDGRIVYANGLDGQKLYIKSSNDMSNGAPINSVKSYAPCYVGDGRIVYINSAEGNKLYIKSINDTSNGTAITSVGSSSLCYVGDGRIVYTNNSVDEKLYIKSINDTANGTAITSVGFYTPRYVGEGRIVYTNRSDLKLYIKSINDTSNGTPITSGVSVSSCYVGDGRVVYRNNSDGRKLYIKSINTYA